MKWNENTSEIIIELIMDLMAMPNWLAHRGKIELWSSIGDCIIMGNDFPQYTVRIEMNDIIPQNEAKVGDRDLTPLLPNLHRIDFLIPRAHIQNCHIW